MPKFQGSLTDSDRMPFGKWKGECLGDVPFSYFRWLQEQDWLPRFPALHKYVTDRDWGSDEDDDVEYRY